MTTAEKKSLITIYAFTRSGPNRVFSAIEINRDEFFAMSLTFKW